MCICVIVNVCVVCVCVCKPVYVCVCVRCMCVCAHVCLSPALSPLSHNDRFLTMTQPLCHGTPLHSSSTLVP